jgi:hypothetical protein
VNRNIGLSLWVVALSNVWLLTGCAKESPPPPPALTDDGGLSGTTDDGRPITNVSLPAQWTTAVTPKPLGDHVQKGLDYLVKQQHANGGWSQGGGWRTAAQGGRVEKAEDPPDVGNTCMATLALVRAGNTPTSGPYANNVARAVEFLCNKVEKADDKSLFVTDVRNTQLQSKIGPYVDTFLTSLVFAELRGRVGEQDLENRLMAALDKTVAKIQSNQRDDGGFAGNAGWATILSQGLAGKGLSRAKQAGANVSDEAIAKVQKQVATNFDGRSGAFRGASRPSESSDAGVALYAASANVANAQDVVAANAETEKRARAVVAQATAPSRERAQAQNQLKNIEDAKDLSDQARTAVVKQLDDQRFVAGFGSSGGEEFLSFLNISETLVSKGGAEWEKWDKTVGGAVSRAQDKDGSWSGQHCITGKTFCTASALLVLMADRTPVPQSIQTDKQK